ncbi:metal-dependent hydrolase [Brachybacterium sp. ACRRE]|uniref:metal-dependent hydrolase n=1 Tax=Brachybacterium sp. ACRRE TaxID=2918184 RepID=UPI001EF36C88|nr:metal-dependent hydrolase [Brachybacterium sp. ACRRE]MCG7309682.1 metal-dependent hydrolase [Brachybacterium sp. ACRRE]
MMGGHHAISGTAAWMALFGSAEISGHALGVNALSLDGPQVLAGAIVTTGAALLPDVDHPSATIARSAGAASKSITSAIGAITGHRGATHTLLSALVFTTVTALVAGAGWSVSVPLLGDVQVGAVVVVTLMCVFATRALKVVDGSLLPWLVGAGAGIVVAAAAPTVAIWLPLSVGLGVCVHLAGDLLTTESLPFPTWPLVMRPPRDTASPLWHEDGNVALPILGNAGSGREWALCAALSGYALLALGATAFESTDAVMASL